MRLTRSFVWALGVGRKKLRKDVLIGGREEGVLATVPVNLPSHGLHLLA